MVYLLGICAAVALGFGYVLQQRVASRARADVLSVRLIGRLIRTPLWWVGTAATVVGQVLGAGALRFGDVAVVEPLLSISLLVTFAVAAGFVRHAPRWQEVLGALLLSAALAVFLGVSSPPTTHDHQGIATTAVVAGALAALSLAGMLVLIAKRQGLAAEAVLLATAAGVLYGLQDVATRGALVIFDDSGLSGGLASPWPYLVVGTGVIGIFLSQSAFGAARLDYSLPPSTATEPAVGIGLGVGMLGENLSITAGALAIDACCLAALVCSVVLIARSPALSSVGAG